jgi:hypothetical protein
MMTVKRLARLFLDCLLVVREPAEMFCFADDLRIASETPLPELVANQRDRRRARLIFLGAEAAADNRLDRKNPQEVRGDAGSLQNLRLGAT